MKTQVNKTTKQIDPVLWIVIALTLTGVMTILSATLFAQQPNEKLPLLEEASNNTMRHLVDFDAVQNSGNVYLKWTVKGQTTDCIYLIQRSRNDKDFKIIGTKNGIGCNPDLTILYCFIDKNPPKGAWYYKIKQINLDLSITDTSAKKFIKAEPDNKSRTQASIK